MKVLGGEGKYIQYLSDSTVYSSVDVAVLLHSELLDSDHDSAFHINRDNVNFLALKPSQNAYSEDSNV